MIERAGKWLFATGDFEQVKTGLEAAGSSLERVARLDQYYSDFDQVPPYQAARKKAFAPNEVAPSTSVVLKGFGKKIEVHALAATAESGLRAERLRAGLNRPDSSGYSPCLRMGDLVFMAGQLARDETGKLAANGVAAETEYIVQKRIAPALEAAGSGLDLVLKAQIYVSQAGKPGLPGSPPTVVVPVPHPAFLTREATVEINVVAAHASARARVRRLEGACAFDELLFMGGVGSEEQAKPILAAASARAVRVLKFGSVLDVWGTTA